MIFVAVFFAWVWAANSVTHLIMPAVALGVRVAFLDRRLPRLPWIVVAGWLLLSAYTFYQDQSQVRSAAMLFMKIALTALCFLHLGNRLGRSKFRRNSHVGQLYFFLTRALILMRTRFDDIAYWRKVRAIHSGRNPRVDFAGLPAAGVAAMIEALSTRKRVIAVMQARGGYPTNMQWLAGTDNDSGIATAAGDVIIMAGMLLAGYVGGSALVPLVFHKIQGL